MVAINNILVNILGYLELKKFKQTQSLT